MQCEYRHWNFSHKNMYGYRKYILWKHTILLYVHMKIPQLRCWLKRMNTKIWMGKSICTRHLIFLNVVSVSIYDFVLCGRNANWYLIPLPKVYRSPAVSNAGAFLTENYLQINFCCCLFQLIFKMAIGNILCSKIPCPIVYHRYSLLFY